MPGDLHHEIAREAIGTLDDDRPRAVGEQRRKHVGETSTLGDRVRAA
jgi:hypothetical protein